MTFVYVPEKGPDVTIRVPGPVVEEHIPGGTVTVDVPGPVIVQRPAADRYRQSDPGYRLRFEPDCFHQSETGYCCRSGPDYSHRFVPGCCRPSGSDCSRRTCRRTSARRCYQTPGPDCRSYQSVCQYSGRLPDAVRRSQETSYTVYYQTADGVTLEPAHTYYGNVGDKPVAAYLYIVILSPEPRSMR